MLVSVLLFSSVTLMASKGQLQRRTGATGGGILRWAGGRGAVAGFLHADVPEGLWCHPAPADTERRGDLLRLGLMRNVTPGTGACCVSVAWPFLKHVGCRVI